MPLHPLRIKNPEELNTFLNKLQALGLITLGNNSISIPNQEAEKKLASQFLKTKNGKLYLLHDVQQFIDSATEEEINSTKLSFYIETTKQLHKPEESIDLTEKQLAQLKIIKKESVSLAQIKADPSLTEKLLVSSKLGELLTHLNPKLFANTALPKFDSVEEIKKERESFDHEKLVSIIQTYKKDAEQMQKLIAPCLISSTAERSTFLRQDIYKIVLIEGIKLKNQLLVKLKEAKNEEEQKEIEQWIKTIEQNNREIKQFLQLTITFLQNYSKINKKDLARYQKLQKEDEIKAQIVAKEKELKSRNNTLNILSTLNSILSVVIFLALLGASVAGIIVGLTVSPATPIAALIYFVVMMTVGIVLTTYAGQMLSMFLNIANFIENKIDNLLKPKREKVYELNHEIRALKEDVIWNRIYPEIAKERQKNEKANELLIEKIKQDLHEVNELDPQEEPKETPVPSPKSPKSYTSSYKGLTFIPQPIPKSVDNPELESASVLRI